MCKSAAEGYPLTTWHVNAGAEAGWGEGGGSTYSKNASPTQHLTCGNSTGRPAVALSDGTEMTSSTSGENRKLAIPFVITVRGAEPSNHMIVTTGNSDVKWLYHQTELGLRDFKTLGLTFQRQEGTSKPVNKHFLTSKKAPVRLCLSRAAFRMRVAGAQGKGLAEDSAFL